ncbi:2Fe-2S iron-sulfur cluster-binding protein [Streptomyces atratus]|uniref:2Fe-2S iron-sulfur cluster-binding protein n=1 Tax=Streptomyces atratus TaxID=1893 RepID=UPI00225B6023|nr:2Fe-2S iron-sulfur cluster-binding protein [Streptomyces atratus]MCX5345375.1 2Fe-2S iron-sulfur cluster-binding protein [Streptomyces atratus]
MTKIIFTQADGTRVTVDASHGDSVMSAALASDVDGITAEYGGNMMCATCHVYVEESVADRLPAMTDDEDQMLAWTSAPRTSASRLSCRLPATEEFDGMAVTVPESQA